MCMYMVGKQPCYKDSRVVSAKAKQGKWYMRGKFSKNC